MTKAAALRLARLLRRQGFRVRVRRHIAGGLRYWTVDRI
jgi:hypothetical protein